MTNNSNVLKSKSVLTSIISNFHQVYFVEEICFKKSNNSSELRIIDGYLFRGRLPNQNSLLEWRTETESYTEKEVRLLLYTGINSIRGYALMGS